MPNLMCNHLIIHGEKAVEIMRSVLSESDETDCGYEFDFEKIKPMPQELDLPYYGLAKQCARLYINAMHEDCDAFRKYTELFKQAYNGDYYTLSDYEQPVIMSEALAWKHWETKKPLFKNKAEVYACGKQALDNYAKYGFVDAKDWREHNWGVYCCAYETQINDMEKADIYFNTAGSPVPPIIQALSEKYPDHKFEYEFVQETPAIGAGYYNYENGIAVSFADYPDESKEAYEMFFALFGMDDEFKFNQQKGTYEPIDAEVM